MRKDNKRRVRYAFGAGVFSLLLLVPSACSVENNWYPKGKVDVVDSYQRDDDFGATAVITYRIENPADSMTAIVATTIALEIVTDVRTYHRTIIETTVIRTGHAIYGVYELELVEPEEAFDEATIADSFFE